MRNFINYSSTDSQQLDPLNPRACQDNYYGACPNYPNGNPTDWSRVFVANQYVQKLAFRVTHLSVESNYDYVKAGLWNGTSVFGDSHTATGIPTVPFTWTLTQSGSNSFQSHPGRVRLTADRTITGSGFTVDYIDALCGASNSNMTRRLQAGERTTGVLLGTNDVVYLYTLMPQDGHTTIALWGDANNAVGTDFDLYMRCGALPTETNYDQRGYRSGVNEFLHVDTGGCSSGQVVYLAVHAFTGKGVFNIMPSWHDPSRHYNLDVGMAFGSGAAQATSFNADWTRLARAVYGATKGGEYIATIRNHITHEPAQSDGRCGNPLTSCWTMIDLPGNGGQTRATTNGGIPQHCSMGAGVRCVAYLGQQVSTAAGLHEWGHAWFNLSNEYCCDPQLVQCGNSIMAANLIQPHNYCMSTNHKYNPDNGATPNTNSDAWSIIYATGSFRSYPTTTPDAYDFTDFDFANLIGVVSNPN